MAKKPQQDFMAESLLLRFLSAPVRWLKILCLAVLILFGSSILLQSSSPQTALWERGLTAPVRMGSRSLWQQWAQPDGRNTESSGTGFNLTVSRTVYRSLRLDSDQLPAVGRSGRSRLYRQRTLSRTQPSPSRAL